MQEAALSLERGSLQLKVAAHTAWVEFSNTNFLNAGLLLCKN